MASFYSPSDVDEECHLNDAVFFGPVTQRELIITWRIRRQERLKKEQEERLKREQAEALNNKEESAQSSSVDEEESDVKKPPVLSEEQESVLEVTLGESPSENTSNTDDIAGQGCQTQDTETEDTEDVASQIDHYCNGNESKESPSVQVISNDEYSSTVPDEFMISDLMAVHSQNPEESANLLKEDEEGLASDNSENFEEAVDGFCYLEGVSIQTLSSEANYSCDNMSINKRSTELLESKLEVFAEQALVEHKEDGSSTTDQSEIYEMSVQGNVNVLDLDYKPQGISRICSSMERESAEEDSVFQIDHSCVGNESNEVTSAKDVSIDQHAGKISGEFVSSSMVMSADHGLEERACLLQENEETLSYEESVEDSRQLLAVPIQNPSKETGYSNVVMPIDMMCMKFHENVLDLVTDQVVREPEALLSGSVHSITDETSSDDQSEIYEMSVDEVGQLNDVVLETSSEASPSAIETPVLNKSSGSQQFEVVATVCDKYQEYLMPLEESLQFNAETDTGLEQLKEASLVDVISILNSYCDIQETKSVSRLASIESVKPQCVQMEESKSKSLFEDCFEKSEVTTLEVDQLNDVVLETSSEASPSAIETSILNKSSGTQQSEVVTTVCEEHQEYLMPMEESLQFNAETDTFLEQLKEASVVDVISILNSYCDIKETKAVSRLASIESVKPQCVQTKESKSKSFEDCFGKSELTTLDVDQLNDVVLETSSEASPSAIETSILNKSSGPQQSEVVTTVCDEHQEYLMPSEESLQFNAETDTCLEQLKEASVVDVISILDSYCDIQETKSVSRLACIESVKPQCVQMEESKSKSFEDCFEKFEVRMIGHEATTTDGIPINYGQEENKENGPASVLYSPPIKSEVEPPRTGTSGSPNPVCLAKAVSASHIPKRSILKPATLNVDQSSLNTAWVKRLNMSKIPKPKRPCYVQPLEKYD